MNKKTRRNRKKGGFPIGLTVLGSAFALIGIGAFFSRRKSLD